MVVIRDIMISTALLGTLTRNLVAAALVIFYAVLLLKLWRYPFGKKKFDRAFRQIGLYNSQKEYPELIFVKKDPEREYGTVYTIRCKGIPATTFNDVVEDLQSALNVAIYRIEYGRRRGHVRLYAIPHKRDKPMVISANSTDFVERLTHMCCCGASGTGKSTALEVILKLFSDMPEAKIVVCDYKGSGFSRYNQTKNYYGYNDVADGIRCAYDEFSERLAVNDEARNRQKFILVVDEYSAFISSREKREADAYKAMLGNMLLMSRSLNFTIILSMQRADSEFFKAGTRDQLRTILAMGNLSKEQKHMLFADYKEQLNHHNSVGEGYLYIDGQGVRRVRIERLANTGEWDEKIIAAMNR